MGYIDSHSEFLGHLHVLVGYLEVVVGAEAFPGVLELHRVAVYYLVLGLHYRLGHGLFSLL